MRGVLTRFGGFCMLASLMAGCSGEARLGHGRGGLDGGVGGSSGSGGDTDAGAPGGSSGTGPGGSSGAGGGGSGVGGTTGGPQVKSDKLDVVLMVDNSRSM